MKEKITQVSLAVFLYSFPLKCCYNRSTEPVQTRQQIYLWNKLFVYGSIMKLKITTPFATKKNTIYFIFFQPCMVFVCSNSLVQLSSVQALLIVCKCLYRMQHREGLTILKVLTFLYKGEGWRGSLSHFLYDFPPPPMKHHHPIRQNEGNF